MELKWKLLSIFWKLSVILKRCQHRSKRYQLYAGVFFFTFCASSFYLLLLWDNTVIPERAVSFKLIQMKLHESIDHSIMGEKGCVFPELDPFSEEAMRFNQDLPKVVCKGNDWVECYMSECKVKSEIIKGFRDVTCSYKDIVYVDDHNYFYGAPTKVPGEEIYKLNRSDHVKISCSGFDKNGLGLISSKWFGFKAGLRPVITKTPAGRESSVNVLILGFDSTSRYGFIRRMPKSYRVLTEVLKATVLTGYHILGDGTAAALFPLLSGRTELEHPDARRRFTSGNLDPKLFIFHEAEEDGYRTAYFEDMPWIGSFQLLHNGFSTPPCQHYLRALLLSEGARGRRWRGARYCLGGTPQYWVMLGLARQVMETEGKKFCFTFIADITHDDFNLISTADEDFAAYLTELKDSGKLKDTLLIVMGDHGNRFSPIRETYQGKIEERLALMSIVLPEKLLEERPKALSALKANADVLTTPFDIHTTMLDAMGLGRLANDYKVPGSGLPRGMSLLKIIPKSRTCGEASILPHWCVCTKWQNVSSADPMFTRSARHLAMFINNITTEKRSVCAERTLTAIDSVMRQGTNEDVLRFRRGMDVEGLYARFVTSSRQVQPHTEHYQARIVMAPGRAVFEGTMMYVVRGDQFIISERDISRITAYGDEPKCVRDTYPHMNKYCFCTDHSKEQSTKV